VTSFVRIVASPESAAGVDVLDFSVVVFALAGAIVRTSVPHSTPTTIEPCRCKVMRTSL